MEGFDIAQSPAALGPAPAARDAPFAGRIVRPVRVEGESGRRGHAEADAAVPVRSGRSRVGDRDGEAVEPDAGRLRAVARGRGHRGSAPRLGARSTRRAVARGREHRGVAPRGADVVPFRPA